MRRGEGDGRRHGSRDGPRWSPRAEEGTLPLPPDAPSGPLVWLRGRAERQLHPWVFRKQVRRVRGRPGDGADVAIVGSDGEPVGRGFYHGRATVAVRVVERGDLASPLDRAWLARRIGECAAFRQGVLGLDRISNAYRIVHGEGDGLSGLVLDRYGDLFVAEIFSRGFWERRADLEAAVGEVFPGARVLIKVPATSPAHEGLPSSIDLPDEEVEIREAKMRFLVRPSGHKTGFFLDQRDNRAAWTELVRGRKVLDAFAYTGAFGVAARTLGKARHVVSVDLDETAVEQGRRNAALNRAEIEWHHEDAFRYLKRHRYAAQPFEAISIDPPKWVQSAHDLETAGPKYIDLNRYAIEALAPGGILVSSCCSGRVSEEVFLGFIRYAAAAARRRVTFFRVAGAAPDHPVDAQCPESRYLKVAFAYVGDRPPRRARLSADPSPSEEEASES